MLSDFFDGAVLAQFGSYILRIAGAVIAGIVLGLERKTRQQSVGMRTLILICVSSCLIMLISQAAARRYGGDSMRIAAQVVSGIGFLGAGAIIRYGLNVKGITSAAIIWTAAAIGLAVGAELYLESLCVLIISVVSLVALERVEERFFPANQIKRLRLSFSVAHTRPDIAAVQRLLAEHGLLTAGMSVCEDMQRKTLDVSFTLKSPKVLDISHITAEIGCRYTLLRYTFSG